MTVFFVSGIWHGAAFTYIIWGVLHGLYQAVGILSTPLREKFYKLVPKNNPILKGAKILGTFCLVCFAWILFRANSLSDAFYIIEKIFSAPVDGILPLAFGTLGLSTKALCAVFIFVVILMVVDVINLKYPVAKSICNTIFVKYAVFFLLLISIVIFGYYGEGFDPQEFVYFPF
jgi:hypothetical protein